MGRPPDKLKAFLRRGHWNEIKVFHDSEYKITLRAAANLLGYFRFPVGWQWTEFKPLSQTSFLDYEMTFAKEAGRPIASNFKNWKVGRKYRRNSVKSELTRLVQRKEIVSYLGRMKVNQQPSRGTRSITQNVPDIEFEHLQIGHSTIGISRGWKYEIWIDAPSLFTYFLEQTEHRGRKLEFNNDAAERFARSKIEASENESLTQARVKNATMDFVDSEFPSDDGDVVTEDQFRPIIEDLWSEYELGK